MTIERRLRVLNCGEDAMQTDTAVRVAFATSDMRHVDQHFGAAESFAIYAVDPQRSSLVEAVEFGALAMDGNEDKLAAKITALAGCIAVYCQAVGASAINQLLAQGVQPVKVGPGTPVTELIAALQGELRAGPSAWLARAIEQQQPRDGRRFDAMEADGWGE
jgi:nitrogen fixation protein NifX